MKKKIAAGLVAIALVAIAVSAGVATYVLESSTSEPEGTLPSISNIKGASHNTPEEFVLNTSLPSVPDKLMVYKVVERNVTREEIAALAERLGMNGSIRETYRRFFVKDGPYHLGVLKVSGRISYIDESRVTPTEKDQENLPSDEEAIEIAKEFLNEKGLMPENAKFSGISYRPVLMHTKEGEITKTFKHITVRFGREINGLPVVFGGSRIAVQVGGYGDVVQLFLVWREYEPYREYPIITSEEAFEAFKRENLNICMRNVSTATINKMYLAYYSEVPGDKQTHFQPVYAFEGVAERDNETEEFWQYVVAAPEFGGIEFPKLKC